MDAQQQFQMQNALRQKMQRFGGVNPMNFNPQAQGAMGFAPSAPQESFGGGGDIDNYRQQGMAAGQDMSWMDNQGAISPEFMQQNPIQGDPRMQGPQMPEHMQMQRNRQMQQRMNVNRGMMQQRPPQMGAAPGILQQPDMSGYKPEAASPDFMGMRNAAAGIGNAMGRTPAAVAKPMGGMGRVAAGLGAAGSAMGLANQAKNAAKKPVTKKPVQGRTIAKTGGQLSQPPTF
jgi:hypothetical protein